MYSYRGIVRGGAGGQRGEGGDYYETNNNVQYIHVQVVRNVKKRQLKERGRRRKSGKEGEGKDEKREGGKEKRREKGREIITQSSPEMRPHSPAYTAHESPLLV